jgi:hypothetical protein
MNVILAVYTENKEAIDKIVLEYQPKPKGPEIHHPMSARRKPKARAVPKTDFKKLATTSYY